MKTTLLKWGVSCILFFSCVSVHSQQMITISQNAAMTQNVACLLVCLLYLARSSFVHKYLVALLAGITHKRNLLQLVLHHPLEVAAQVSEDKKDIERPLMV